MTIASTLVKADRLLEKLKAAQPVDPFASFSTEQHHYYEQWWVRFKAQHSETPDALYEALLDYTKCAMWTPAEWLDYPRITTEMTMNDAQSIYFDQLGKRQ